MRYRKLLISILAATSLISAPVNANVGSGMQSWFNSLGGYTNTTPPSAYKGQTQNGYSAGGIYQRSPVKNYQLTSMTPPSLNIGCGGIDLTAGSFSFINKASITALFQNIGTSLSYAFLLAIQASMPDMANLFKYLQDVANKVNGMNVNSCKLSSGIPFVKGADLSDNLSTMFSHVGGAVTNMFPDSFDSLTNTQGNAGNAVAAENAAIAQDQSKKDQIQPGNVVWKAVNKSSGLDTQDMLFIMSLTGTIIIDPPNGTTNAKTSWRYKDPTGVDIKDFIGYNDGQTTTVNIFACDTTTDCLNPTVSSITVTPFYNQVSTAIDNLRNNVVARGVQNTNDFKLVDASIMPVWKMISTSASVNPGFIEAYKRLIAVDIAYAYINNILVTASQALANSQNGPTPQDAQDALQKLSDRIIALKTELQTTRLAEYSAVQKEAELERQLQLMHQSMVAGIPAQAFTSMTVFGVGH